MRDDASLFVAWQAGDRAAGEALIERHFDAIDRFFATKVGDGGDDLVQSTFLACAEAGARYRGDSSFRAFLFGIARNVLFEHIRGKVRHGVAPADLSQSAIADLAPGVATLANHRADQRQHHLQRGKMDGDAHRLRSTPSLALSRVMISSSSMLS